MWPMTGDQMSSVWFSLDPMRPETGALRFVAGSHKGPAYVQYAPNERREMVEADTRSMPGGAMPAIEGHEVDYDILSFATEPGDVVLFSPKVIHATYGSVSDRSKRSFSVRYLGDDIRWLNKPYGGFHAWMKDVVINDGDPLDHACFPQAWPKS
jgi:ectoine hydroxylase-related dioxygenase (phytanoyl-CoA dioxygenase family)